MILILMLPKMMIHKHSAILSLFLSLVVIFSLASCAALVPAEKLSSAMAHQDSLQNQLKVTQSQMIDLQTRNQRLQSDTARLMRRQLLLTQKNDELLGKISTDEQSPYAQLDQLSADIEERETRLREVEEWVSQSTTNAQILKNSLQESLSDYDKKGLSYQIKEGKLHILITTQLLFNASDSLISDEGMKVLSALAQPLKDKRDININIEGNTDNQAPTIGKDNWDLSMYQAITVLKYLQTKGKIPANMLRATAKSEYNRVAANEFPPGRVLNKRVEIIIESNMENISKWLFR